MRSLEKVSAMVRPPAGNTFAGEHPFGRYFEAVCNNATVAMFIMDEQQQCVYMNPAAEKLTGFTLEEVAGKPLHNCIHHTRPDGSEYPLSECPIDRVFPTTNQEQGEEVFVHKDGSFYPIAYTASPIREKGKVVGTIIEVQDLTQRKIAEGKQRETEQRFERLLSSLPAAVYTTDAKGRILFFNEAAVRLWGRRPQIGKDLWCGSWRIFDLDGTELPLDSCPMALAIHNGRSIRGREIIVERPDGTRSHVLPYPDPMFDRTGKLLGAVNMLVDISDLRRTEEALRHSEQRMHQLMTMMPVGVYTCDLEGRITFYNRRAAQLWGREPQLGSDEQKFCGAFRLWLPNGTPLPHEKNPVQQAITEGKSTRSAEVIIERSDGSRTIVSVNVEPLMDSTGTRCGAINVFQDITPLKQSENALRENLERFHFALEATSTGFWEWDAKTDIVHFSRRGSEIFGVPHAPVTWTDLSQRLHPEDYQRVRLAVDQAITTRSGYEIEYRVMFAKEARWIAAKGRARYGLDGRVSGMLGFIQDITERKQAEEALHRRTRTLETVNRTGATLAAELDLEKLVQSVTDAATEVTGAKFGAFFYNLLNDEGESYMLYTLSGAPREAFERFGQPRNTPLFGPTFRGEGILRVGDITRHASYGKNPPHHGMPKGHLPVRSYLAVPVISRSGEVLGGLFFGHPEPDVFTEDAEKIMVGIAAQAAIALDNAKLYQALRRELAEHKRAEEALRESEARLAKTNEQLDKKVNERTASLQEAVAQLEEFSYSVSHDLRAPLRAVDGYVKVILEDHSAELNEEVRNYLEKIARNTFRMHKLINDVLTLSRVARSEMRMGPVNLGPLIYDIIEQHPQMQRPKAEINIGELHPVYGDELSLSQALSNLLANAVKFVPPGRKPKVNVWAEPRGKEVRLWVEDNGIGIKPEYQSKLFGVFQRLTEQSKYEGTGIGLAIVRKALERMGGSFGVESNGVDGSRFWVQLKSLD